MSTASPIGKVTEPVVSGVVVPMLTPLLDDGTLDTACARRMARRLVDAGVDGLFLLGSCGEGAALLDEDRRELVESVASEVAGRIRVMAGISESGTARALQAAVAAQQAGADALVFTLPHYFRAASQEEVESHFRAVAEATALPVVMYNIPQMVKSAIEPDTVRRLARVPNIVGIKESSGDWGRFQGILAGKKQAAGFSVLQGQEKLMAASLLCGADGVVPATANLVPELFVCLMGAALRDEREIVLQLQERVTALSELYCMEVHWLAALKYAANLLGLCARTVCTPVCGPDHAAADRIEQEFLPLLLDPLAGVVPEHAAVRVLAEDKQQVT